MMKTGSRGGDSPVGGRGGGGGEPGCWVGEGLHGGAPALGCEEGCNGIHHLRINCMADSLWDFLNFHTNLTRIRQAIPVTVRHSKSD